MASESALDPMPTCSKCQTKALKVTANYCKCCGNSLQPIVRLSQRARCINTSCQKELEPGETFCEDCGTGQNAAKESTAKSDQVPEGNVTGSCHQETGHGSNSHEVDSKLVPPPLHTHAHPSPFAQGAQYNSVKLT